MTRNPRRGPWLPEEDIALVDLVRTQGPNNWVRISQQLQHRSPKQCRERYHQNLKPSLNHEPISAQEGEEIEQLVNEMGKRWAEIARRLGNRSDNAVKNWWNGSMNRRKRTPSQHHSLKHSGHRLHPLPPPVDSRSFNGPQLERTLPSPTQHQTSNQWTPSETSPGCSRTLQPPLRRDLYSPDKFLYPTMLSKADERGIHPSTDREGSYFARVPGHHAAPQLPPLHLPPLIPSQGAYQNPGNWKSSTSPAISEISQSLSSRPPPSLISDSHSICSVSPKTMTSPRADECPEEKAGSRPMSYGYRGVQGQLPLTPLETNAMSDTRYTISDQSRLSSHDIAKKPHYGAYADTLPPLSSSLRDRRMHVSSLVQ